MGKNKKYNIDHSLGLIDDTVDAISNISIYLTIASRNFYRSGNCDYLNRLRNQVKVLAPTIYYAFDHYLFFNCKVYVNSETGHLNFDKDKALLKCPVSFIVWLRSNNEAHKLFSNIDYDKLDKVVAIQSKIPRTSSTPNNPLASSNIIQYRTECCPCCGKKFRIGSPDNIENHSCRKDKTSGSIWTISGGGGPGTGKRK